MRTLYLLVAAVPLGLAAGYAWSDWSRPIVHMAVPPVVQPKPFDPPEAAADKAWEERADEQGRLKLEAAPDPTIVDQSVYYKSCSEARAAGKAPIHAGEPGYRSGLDADGDGIACEPIRS